jgi:hypothetical protein
MEGVGGSSVWGSPWVWGSHNLQVHLSWRRPWEDLELEA